MTFFLRTICILITCTSCLSKEKQDADYKHITEDTITATAEKSPVISTLEQKMIDSGMINVSDLDSTILIDLKYATTDNFTKTVLYDSLTKAYLHPIAARKLAKAQELLKKENAGYSLLVYDAVRPLSVQKKMYEVVQNTKYKAYVANPTKTGLHNYGIAVDLTIANTQGNPLDMGTPFDFFGKQAGITNETAYLSEKQIENRKLLRKVMTGAGFLTIRGEWWHFNALSLAQAKAQCKLIE